MLQRYSPEDSHPLGTNALQFADSPYELTDAAGTS
jgi:hypothetical protein